MNTLTLPAICDRAAARAIQPEMCDAVGSEELIVDASGVERIGQAMLQVIVAAARTESGITLKTPSDPFRTALRLAGLDESLGAEIEKASAS